MGLPLGLRIFQSTNVDQLKVVAAVTLLTFVALAVLRKPRLGNGSDLELRFRTPSAVGVGLVAGGMTAALGMPGPAVVLYLTAIGIRKDATRSITLTFFAVAFGASLILQSTTVGVSVEVWIAAGLLVPVAVLGALLGHALARRISEAVFRKAVLSLVAATAAYVLLDTILQ
jgi:uncharacterized membrane protein YfcA